MSDSEDLMRDQDRIEAYKQLLERAQRHGFACVNELVDEYETLKASNHRQSKLEA